MSKNIDRTPVFLRQFREDLAYCVRADRKAAVRTLELVVAIIADPFAGVGKPEPLRFDLAGCWSRRVTQQHRLVYRIAAGRIDFLQARYHYE